MKLKNKRRRGGKSIENTKTVLGVLDVTQGVKGEVISYVAKTDASINNLKYVKVFKLLSKGLFAAQAGISIYQVGDAFYTNDGNKWGVLSKSSVDVFVGYISLVGGPWGLGLGAVYFVADSYGCFGNWGKTAPVITPIH